jgi:ribosomal protein S18 acetylase RimI-like enzyme
MLKNRDLLTHITKRNLAQFLKFLPSRVGTSSFYSYNGIECSYSGFKTSILNSIVGGNLLDEHADDNAAKILAFFGRHKASSMWWMERVVETESEVIEMMRRYGFDDMVRLKGMYLNMFDFDSNIDRPECFDIVLVDSRNSFQDFAFLYSSFASERLRKDVAMFYEHVAEQKLFLSNDVKYFVGYYMRQPVCTGSICFGADAVGIYDVLTVKGYRNRGFASSLVSQMLNMVKKSGAKLCVLQSSLEAVSIYSSFGFQEFGDFYVMNNEGFFDAHKDTFEYL